MAQRHRLNAGERGLCRRAGGAEQPVEPTLAGTFRGGEHATDRPDAPVERQLADGGVPLQPLPGNLVRCREHGQRDRQVEARALLPQSRRREIHGDPVSRPLETCRGDTRAHAMLRLLARTVCKAHDCEAGQAALDVGLNLHAARVEAD